MEKTYHYSKTLLAKCISLACPALIVGAAFSSYSLQAKETIATSSGAVILTHSISEVNDSAVEVSGSDNSVTFSPGNPGTDVLRGQSGIVISGNNNSVINNGVIVGQSTVAGGANAGLRISGEGVTGVTNNGVVTAAADGIYARHFINVKNNGTIESDGDSAAGLYINDGGTYIGSAGSVLSGKNIAITLDGETSTEGNLIDNTGTIKATNSEAIQVYTKSKIINREGGRISSVAAEAIRGLGEAELAIENYGTLESGSGTAIRFTGSASNSLTLGTGSAIIGNVVSHTSNTNSLILTGEGNEDADFIGSVPTNGMKSLTMRGRDWTLSGDVSFTGNDENTLVVEQGKLTLSGLTASRGNALIASGSSLGVAAGGELNAPGITVASGATALNAGTMTGNVVNNGTYGAWNTLNPGAATNGIVDGNFTNNGTLNLAGSEAGNTLAITGNYTGNAGRVVLNAVLADDASTVDHFSIGGKSLGRSTLTVNNVGGMGAQTLQGIELISVAGASGGTFTLDNRVVAGAYEYNLFQSATDGAWYLSSTATPTQIPTPAAPSLMRPEVGAYLGNQLTAQQMFISSMYDRYIPTATALGGTIGGVEALGWARIVANSGESHAANGQLDLDTSTAMLQFGGDLYKQDGIHAGLMAGIANSKIDSTAKNNGSSASGSVSGYSAGAYGTWFENEAQQLGMYVDVWGQYNWYSNKVYGDRLTSEKYSSQAFQGSLEAGYSLAFGRDATREWAVTPQAQAIYTHYDQHVHTEANGTRVTGGTDDNVITRLGVRLANRSYTDPTGMQLYSEANWINGQNADLLSFNEIAISNDVPENRYEAVVGIAGKLSNRIHVYGQGSGQWGENSYNNYEGQVGVRVNF